MCRTEERRPSETDNDQLSDNVKRSGSETEIKDLSEDNLDAEKDEDGKTEDVSENQDEE